MHYIIFYDNKMNEFGIQYSVTDYQQYENGLGQIPDTYAEVLDIDIESLSFNDKELTVETLRDSNLDRIKNMTLDEISKKIDCFAKYQYDL